MDDQENSLKNLRKRLRYTQDDLANLLGVQREAVSMWESGRRKPTEDQLQRLERLLNTNAQNLLFTEPRVERELPKRRFDESVFRKNFLYSIRDKQSVGTFEVWFEFLDRWAAFTAKYDLKVTGPIGIEEPLSKYIDMSDGRYALTIARLAREHIGLEVAASPDPHVLLASLGFYIFEATLDKSGCLFYNHHTLGPCLLLNRDLDEGERYMTLLRQLAIALIHHRQILHLTLKNYDAKVDRFSRFFAKHFAVEGPVLRSIAETVVPSGIDRNNFQRAAKELASYFNMPSSVMETRLVEERVAKRFHYKQRLLDAENTVKKDNIFKVEQKYEALLNYPNRIKDDIYLLICMDKIKSQELGDLFKHEKDFTDLGYELGLYSEL